MLHAFLSYLWPFTYPYDHQFAVKFMKFIISIPPFQEPLKRCTLLVADITWLVFAAAGSYFIIRILTTTGESGDCLSPL